MPCHDERDDKARDVGYKLGDRLSMVEAILCGVLRAVNSEHIHALFDEVDWSKAGVSRDDAMQWWATHLRKDGG